MPLAGFLHMAGFKDRTHDLRTRAGAGSSGFGVALIVGDALLLQGGGLLAAVVAVDGDHGGDAEPDAGGGDERCDASGFHGGSLSGYFR